MMWLLPLTKSSSVSPCSSLEALVLASPVLCRPMTTHMPPSIASKAASAVFLTYTGMDDGLRYKRA